MLRKAVLVQVTNASPPFHSLIESRKADKDFEDFQDEITDNSVFLTTLTALASNQLQRCEELAGVDLGSSRLEALSAVMAGNTSCTHLILSPSRFEPGLGQEGTARTGSAERCHMFSLCRNIASASALTQLDITNCSLRSEDAKAVAAMLAQPECALRHLHLSRNPNFGQGVSSRALFQALHRNSRLQVLHVAGCHITCGRDLAEMLEVNTTLTELNIADNLMSLEVAVVALRALGGSKALTALDLSRSFLRHATAEAFSEALAHNGVLARLRVDGVELGREGESRLAAALRTNDALETIEGMEWLGVEMPPGEICRQGCGAIRQFWEDAGMRKPQETSTGPVRRMIPDWTLKVVMVGPGQAGKTSLVKTLRGEAFQALSERERTIGIEVSEIVLPGVDSGAQDDSLGTPRLRVFDFAGQQEYYTLHRFLLTSKALYLLVFDSTQVSPHPDMDDGAQLHTSSAGLISSASGPPTHLSSPSAPRATPTCGMQAPQTGTPESPGSARPACVAPYKTPCTGGGRGSMRRLATEERCPCPRMTHPSLLVPWSTSERRSWSRESRRRSSIRCQKWGKSDPPYFIDCGTSFSPLATRCFLRGKTTRSQPRSGRGPRTMNLLSCTPASSMNRDCCFTSGTCLPSPTPYLWIPRLWCSNWPKSSGTI